MKPYFHLVIDSVHMGLGHAGLAELAKKLKVDPASLEPGQLLLFINNAQDKVKIMGGRGTVIGYYKHPRGRINLEALQYVPASFGGGEIKFDTALRRAVTGQLARKRSANASPLEVYRASRA